MSKTSGVILLTLVVLLAGCNGAQVSDTTATPEINTTETETSETETDTSGTDSPDAGPATDGQPLADPATDRIGWEEGYWHNETVDVTNANGLNESERERVVARTMARVEYVRDAEFNESVPVSIISREEFRAERTRNFTDEFRTFDNGKFEALFLVGEPRDAIAVQRANRGSSVLGYYDPRNGTIKLVSDTGQPVLDGEGTLAHELLHALQDQQHNLSGIRPSTRDESNGQSGLIEGEANLVQQRYEQRCGAEWSCLGSGGDDTPSIPEDFHFGIYLLSFFPYSDGPGFVDTLENDGWDDVDAAFDDPPESAAQIINPDRYTDGNSPTEVELTDSATNGWERIRPEPQQQGHQRPDYATLGQSALSTMFMYTAFDRSNRGLVSVREIRTGDESDPVNYEYDVTDGWNGDRLHLYRNDDTGPNETAYVWRLEWESASDAQTFAGGYRQLLEYWGGTETNQPDTWRIPDGESGFADAFYVDVDGSTVTIVNAPTTDDLEHVSDVAE